MARSRTKGAPVASRWLELAARFPLWPIRSGADNERASALMGELLHAGTGIAEAKISAMLADKRGIGEASMAELAAHFGEKPGRFEIDRPVPDPVRPNLRFGFEKIIAAQ